MWVPSHVENEHADTAVNEAKNRLRTYFERERIDSGSHAQCCMAVPEKSPIPGKHRHLRINFMVLRIFLTDILIFPFRLRINSLKTI